MSWRKLGLLFAPGAPHPKLATHAANPLAVPISEHLFRVYYSGRDGQNRSSVGYVELDMRAQQITYAHPEPVFEHGPPGSFYADGVSIGCAHHTAAGAHRMLFMGWQVPPGEHWVGDIGALAIAPDGSLSLAQPTPIITRGDTMSLSYPWVLGARMWYGATHTWDAGNGEMLHPIHTAHSADGLHWTPDGVAIPFALGEAQAFSRPAVVRDAEGFKMWYSYRSGTGEAYRIGYATSADGLAWQRQHALAGIDVSPAGWDSEMVCYPFVFDYQGARYMLYNGNGHGRTGFGLAIQEPAR